MKHDWEYKKLGSICNILNGFAFKSDRYEGAGTRIIRITNVQKGFIVDDDPKYYPNSEMEKLSQYVLRNGDLLMSLTGNVGRVGILSSEFLPAALNQRVACIRRKSDDLNLQYLFHYFNSSIFEESAIFNASGIAQKNMSTEWLKNTSIPTPPLSVQEQIASELDKVSEVIEKKKQQVKELDTLAQSLFYEMFGDPITNEKGWDVKKMKDVAPISEYKGTPPNNAGKYWLLNLDKIESQTGRVLDVDYFDKSEIGTSVVSFDDSNVLYSKLRPYLNKVVIPHSAGYASSELLPLKPQKDVLNRYYLALMLRSKSFVSFINIKVAGAKMPRVSMDTFRDFPIPVPPLPLQRSFAEKIEAIERQKGLINWSIKEVQTLFDSRMDYYFGE